MKLHISLIYLLAILGLGCNAQRPADYSAEQKAMGDTVSQLGNSILYIFQAANGDYWFGSDTNGVFQYDGKTLMHYSEMDGLSSNRIRGIQEDKSGNIFFSTLGGIDKFNGHNFSQLSPIRSTSTDDHWKLQADDLWFSMTGRNGEKGPYRYDGKNLYQLQFPEHYMAADYFKRFPNNAWSPYDVYCMYKDHRGTMWFGTSNFGICRYDGKNICWLYEDHLTNVPNGGSFGIRSILEDRNGKFWFCNTNYRFSVASGIKEENGENGKKLIPYQKEAGILGIKSVDGADAIYFLSIAEDDQGDLWMVTYNEGVWRYNGKSVTHYEVKDGDKDTTLFSIYKDSKGTLWLGTHGSGAYKFNGKSFEKFRL